MARILVIDDDSNVRLTIKTILERNGHSVVLAACGDRGIAITEIYAFAVVIIDIFMPGMDGLETVKLLRRCEPEVKVLAISGYDFREKSVPAPDFLQMAHKLGATCCLRKPFRAQELLEAVEVHCLGNQRGRRRA